MKSFIAFLSALLAFVCFVLFSRSDLDDHSLFYISGQSLYETVRADGSFGSAPAFYIIDRIQGLKQKFHTGEFEIKRGDTVLSFIIKMINMQRVRHKLMIPEGYTVQRIVKVIQQNDLLFGEVSGSIEEGSLFPSTYFYYFGDTKDSIVSRMRDQMQRISQKIYGSNKTTLSLKEMVTLASIIEKETGGPQDSLLISSVFHNRLAINMRLQSDPTVIYALTGGFGILERKLTKKDLLFDSPYNTYRKKGLPPTPICCPGERSLLAAITPPKTDYLFFFATKQRVIFTKNYKDHLKVKHANAN